MMCGGISKIRTDAKSLSDAQEISNSVRGAVEQKHDGEFTDYTVLAVTTQVVAGMNYFVKVHIGNDVCTHLRIYKPLPGQGDPQFHSHQHPKSKDEELKYF